MDNNVVEVIKGIVGQLKDIASAEAVIGRAVTVGDKTVVPIVKVTVGFGAGGGQGEREKTGGFGAGGGGGAVVEPVAFIVMDSTGISLLPVKPGKLESVVEAIPGVVTKILELKDRMKKSSSEHKDAE